jgi:signal transduction histidine kinase
MNNLLFSLNDFIKNMSDTLGIWYLIILNAFGVIAIIFKVIEYQVKKRNTMFIMVIVANACWVCYFALYGDLASSLTCAINFVKFLIFMRRETCAWARSILWLYFFLIVQIIVAIFTVTSWLNIFSIVAGFIGIFAYFVVDGKKYRLLSFVHMAMWVVNSAVNFYLIALISDSVSTLSCGVAIYRYDLSKKAKTISEQTKENKDELEQNLSEDKLQNN